METFKITQCNFFILLANCNDYCDVHDHVMQFLNTNLTLYNAVLKAEKDKTLTSDEAKRVARDLCVDFEKGGIHLCAGFFIHFVV